MPTKLPKFQVALPEELYQALKDRAGAQGMSAYVRGLIERDLGVKVEVQHGGQHNRLPAGWRSRLYQDRYQFVAVVGGEPIYHHYHDYTFERERLFDTLRVDTPVPAEIYVLDVPVGTNRSDLQHELQAAFYDEMDNLLIERDKA